MSKRLAAFIVIAVVSAISLGIVWERHIVSSGVTMIDWKPIGAALTAYTRDLQVSNRPIPPEIALSQLVRQGYLRTNDITAFQGAEVTLSLTDHAETFPHQVLARAVMRDGASEVVLYGDGSVQQRSRKQ